MLAADAVRTELKLLMGPYMAKEWDMEQMANYELSSLVVPWLASFLDIDEASSHLAVMWSAKDNDPRVVISFKQGFVAFKLHLDIMAVTFFKLFII